MKLFSSNHGRTEAQSRAASAWTLIEVMVTLGISILVMAGAMFFMWSSGMIMSGVTAQALRTQQAGNAIEFIQSRARLAVSVSNNVSGNSLTLAFDDDPTTDSDHDGIPYNDRDHFERFTFIGVNGSTTNATTNSLVYFSNINSTNRTVLIPSGVRNLPGYNIFTVTNLYTSVIRFGVVDTYRGDHYQSIDIQGTALPLNRRAVTNFIAILP